ncbi:HEPN domain-containing protein [Pseudomonas moorei]|uniref:HEPN domain-containing protein n=1 Tax=Pseudomonas moorei TaxID=395599 RepID=UPI0036F341B3
MLKALEAARESLLRVEHLGGLYSALQSLTTSAIDSSDLLRAQVVLAVSALDFYIHEVTVAGMLEVIKGDRPSTPAFDKNRVSVGAMLGGMQSQTFDWFEADVRERHSFLSFQQPEKIADAVRLFSNVRLWETIAEKMGDNEVKSRLRLIVDRRNKIAHEADMSPSYPGERWPITQSDVAEIRVFIGRVVEAIHESVVSV